MTTLRFHEKKTSKKCVSTKGGGEGGREGSSILALTWTLAFVTFLSLLQTTLAQQISETTLRLDKNVTSQRSGIIDVVTENDQEDVEMSSSSTSSSSSSSSWGHCHIALYSIFTMPNPDPESNEPRVPFPLYDAVLSGLAAAHLAAEMLNQGDTSIILTEIPDSCPIQFSVEGLDTFYSATYTANSVSQVLDRDEKQVCAFLGALSSWITIPMAILTGLAGRPHLDQASDSTHLSDKTTFPLFGRLVPSAKGNLYPLVMYLKQMNVNHFGMIHWNDFHGNSLVQSLLENSQQHHPDLQVVARTINAVPCRVCADSFLLLGSFRVGGMAFSKIKIFTRNGLFLSWYEVVKGVDGRPPFTWAMPRLFFLSIF